MTFQIGDLVKYRSALISDTTKLVGYVIKTHNNGYEDMAMVQWLTQDHANLPYVVTTFIYMSKLQRAY